MSVYLDKLSEIKINRVIKALEKNLMKGYFAKTKEEVVEIVDNLTKYDKLITSGGSLSLIETGLIDFLNKNRKDVFLPRESASTPEEVEEIFRKAFISDTYIASSNAVTENGELYNIDGNGNRVSAMIFGPKQVILIVGINKIVPDMAGAEMRLKSISAPANCIRLGKKTPCSAIGKCMECNSMDRICCSYVKLAQQRYPDRIKVILTPFDLGL